MTNDQSPMTFTHLCSSVSICGKHAFLRVFLRVFAPSRSPLYLILLLALPPLCLAQNNLGSNDVPYHQSKPPGPALSPDEAMAHMQLPPGFRIECVAHEPDVVN